MNTLTGGKSKKQAGLGDIDSRLAEIRDATTALFYPPDKMVVLTFLFVYLEVLYGYLVVDKKRLEQLSDEEIYVNGFTPKFNDAARIIKLQFFYKNYPKLLRLSGRNPKDPLIAEFEENILALLPPGGSGYSRNDFEQPITARMKRIQDLEVEINHRFFLGLDEDSLTPIGRLIVGNFLLIYLEVFSGFLSNNYYNKDDNVLKMVDEVIQQEYFYAQQKDKLLIGDLKEDFEKIFNPTTLNTEEDKHWIADNITAVEQRIFYCIKPLMPF